MGTERLKSTLKLLRLSRIEHHIGGFSSEKPLRRNLLMTICCLRYPFFEIRLRHIPALRLRRKGKVINITFSQNHCDVDAKFFEMQSSKNSSSGPELQDPSRIGFFR